MEVGYLYAIGAAVIWGLVYTIDQKLLYTMSPLVLLAINAVIVAILALPILIINRQEIANVLSSGKSNLFLFLVSVLLTLLANYLILSGIKNLDASVASIIEIAYPFFVVIFSYIFFKSSPNIYFFIGGLLVFIGSFIIIKFS